MAEEREPMLPFMTKEKTAHELSRRTDPDTSYTAGEKIVPKLRLLQHLVLEYLVKAGPLTDYEIEAAFADHGSTYRTRRAELTEMGLVEDTGRTRIIRGRARKVWRAK